MSDWHLKRQHNILAESKFKPQAWLATHYGQQAEEKYTSILAGKDASLLSGIENPSEELIQMRDRFNNFRAYAELAQSIIKKVYSPVPYQPVGGQEVAGRNLSLESGFRMLTHPGKFNYSPDTAIRELASADRQLIQLFSIARAEYHMANDADPDSPDVAALKFCHEVVLPAMQDLIPALTRDAKTLDRLAKDGAIEVEHAETTFAQVDRVQAHAIKPPPQTRAPTRMEQLLKEHEGDPKIAVLFPNKNRKK